MKKIFLPLLIATSSLLGLTSCDEVAYLARPEDTNLEFWITEEVTIDDFEAHIQKPGMFGGRVYYGLEYVPTTDENGDQVPPKNYVTYTVTHYPDYSSEPLAVTSIEITDPSVTFYGLTTKCTLEQFTETMEENGFQVYQNELYSSTQNAYTAEKNKVFFDINLDLDTLDINVVVTNKNGLYF